MHGMNQEHVCSHITMKTLNSRRPKPLDQNDKSVSHVAKTLQMGNVKNQSDFAGANLNSVPMDLKEGVSHPTSKVNLFGFDFSPQYVFNDFLLES